MTRTDTATVRENIADNAKDSAASALGLVRAQAAVAGENLSAATRSALDVASKQGKSALDSASKQGKKVGRRASKRAKALADEAAKVAAKSAKDARKRADKAASKAGKKGKKKAHELSIVVQEKAGRHPRRKRRVVVFGGLALAGITVVTVVKRRGATDDYAPVPPVTPVAAPPSEAPGDSPS